ncbi:hypothetical protein ACFVSX_32090 [Streptomyces rubiginosohelvolus]|uniref:hypothetical protein n=1 Tax=Streptomyces rubiginosohelvolus TaxID=67362 RepID=UPI0036DB3C40
MTDQKIGAQLDELGLVVDMEEGDRVAEAVITVTTRLGSGALMDHQPVCVPPQFKPVPDPVQRRVVTVMEANQLLSEGQKQRVRAWLEANGIDPKWVSAAGPITVHSRAVNGNEGGYRIKYTEFCRGEDGQRFADPGVNAAVTVERCVLQAVPLDEGPEVRP